MHLCKEHGKRCKIPGNKFNLTVNKFSLELMAKVSVSAKLKIQKNISFPGEETYAEAVNRAKSVRNFNNK